MISKEIEDRLNLLLDKLLKLTNDIPAIEDRVKIQELKVLQKRDDKIVDQQLKASKKIKLDVGGIKFSTTLTTLTSDADSMLSAMFSGRFSLERDEDGSIFIDRNGKYFAYILEFLRTGDLDPNIPEGEWFGLKREAEYFQVSKLVRALRSKEKTKAKDKKEKFTMHIFKHVEYFHRHMKENPDQTPVQFISYDGICVLFKETA